MTKVIKDIETNKLFFDELEVYFEPLAGSFNLEQYLLNISSGISIDANKTADEYLEKVEDGSRLFIFSEPLEIFSSYRN